MKYFLFADPHGHYTELKEALLDAGYDETNDNHQLIGLGDYFDRGTENGKMAAFLLDQWEKGKAKFILGNHDIMLLDFLRGKDDGIFNSIYNGFDKTIEDLANIETWQLIYYEPQFVAEKIRGNYPKLLEWLYKMEDKIEIENFVLTHAGYSNKLKDPYRTDKWEIDNWAKTDFFVKWFATSDDFVLQKTYIFGHWHAFDLRQKFQNGDGTPSSEPFIHRNFIGLDACTALTKKVNIYIIDEEVI